MTIGERIKQVRTKKGLTQKQLGSISGTSEITIRQYELGKRQPRLEQLRRIADALGISLDLLLSKDEANLYDIGVSEGQEALIQVYRDLDGYSFNRIEAFLIHAFSILNDEGQKKAVERVEELTEIPRYRRPDAPEPPLSSTEVVDTAPPPDAPETPSEGE